MIVTYENGGRYSAATAAGVLFYGVSRVEGERQLITAGIDPAALDSSVDGLTWRSTLTTAFANEIAALNDSIESLALTQDVDDIRERQDALHDQVNDLRRSVRRSDIRQEIARCEQILWQEELPQLMRAVGKRANEHQCSLILRKTSPTAKRIEALHAEWQELMQ